MSGTRGVGRDGDAKKKRLSPGLEDGPLNNLMHIYVYMYDYVRNCGQGAPNYSPASSFLAGIPKSLRQKGTLGALSASVVRLTSSS